MAGRQPVTGNAAAAAAATDARYFEYRENARNGHAARNPRITIIIIQHKYNNTILLLPLLPLTRQRSLLPRFSAIINVITGKIINKYKKTIVSGGGIKCNNTITRRAVGTEVKRIQTKD